ncbi:MAG: GAP family protein [Candidatus Daviesbacteria bacterium]|nr:GAP family protein [Candidatus Daviesbacteria bacterium]
MFELFVKVLSLGIASLFSPLMLAMTIILMGSKFHPIKKTICYILGLLIVSIGVIIVGLSVSQITEATKGPDPVQGIIDGVLGILLLAFAIKTLISKDKEHTKRVESSEVHILKLMALGIAVNLSNLDGLTLSFISSKTVGEAAVGASITAILLLINIFFVTLPGTMPLLLYYISPKKSTVILHKIHDFSVKYGPYVIAFVFGLFGIILLNSAWTCFK